MPRCSYTYADSSQCRRIVSTGQPYCYSHDPARDEERRRNAAKGGKNKGNQKLSDLDRQLKDLAADALAGEVERGVAAVVNQIINTRIRLIEQERKIKELEELEAEQRKQAERMEALESVLKMRSAR